MNVNSLNGFLSKAQFLQATDLLLQKESEIFLKMIKESREELNGVIQGIQNGPSGMILNAWKTGMVLNSS